MGRYAGKITHQFSKDKSRPTFQETIREAQLIFLRHYMEKLSPEERAQLIEWGKKEGYFV